MYVSPITVVHNYKNVNLQIQPKRKYWQEDISTEMFHK